MLWKFHPDISEMILFSNSLRHYMMRDYCMLLIGATGTCDSLGGSTPLFWTWNLLFKSTFEICPMNFCILGIGEASQEFIHKQDAFMIDIKKIAQ